MFYSNLLILAHNPIWSCWTVYYEQFILYTAKLSFLPILYFIIIIIVIILFFCYVGRQGAGRSSPLIMKEMFHTVCIKV